MILSRQSRSYFSRLEHCQATLSRGYIFRTQPGDEMCTYTHTHPRTQHARRTHTRNVGLSVNLFVYLTLLFQYKSLGPADEYACLWQGDFTLFHFGLHIKIQISRDDSAAAKNQRLWRTVFRLRPVASTRYDCKNRIHHRRRLLPCVQYNYRLSARKS